MSEPPIVVHHAPGFGPSAAAELAERLFGITGTPEPLPSERDQNYRITDGAGGVFVLKIANATEAREVLDLQHQAIARLTDRSRSLALPRLVPALTGETISRVEGPAGQAHFVRMLTWVPGVPLAGVRPHTTALLRTLGQRLGEMDLALEGFSHPAADRAFAWDLCRMGWVRHTLAKIRDDEQRRGIGRCLERFDDAVAPRLSGLRGGVIHNDWNDHNVLVSLPPAADRRVVGAVDFGDMVRAPWVVDLAVAAAYAMLNKPDRLAAAAAVVGGYHDTLPLTDPELSVLYDCICARLALSMVMAARQTAAAPANEYLRVSQHAVWTLLRELLATPPAWAYYVFRAACGVPACPQAASVVQWLNDHRDRFTRVLDDDLAHVRAAVLDLGVGSLDIPRLEDVQDVASLTARIAGEIAREDAAVGIGRYDEVRLAYTSPLFQREANDGPENRTVHVGIDLFVPPGSSVYAPFDGRVHSVRDNAGPLDYGPTIVLAHDIPADSAARPSFFTLYGHLSRQSLDGLEPGAPVVQGERIAAIGDRDVNGGWPPHLHFQLILDMLGREGDFPGVAPPSQRDVWLSLCPDPSPLLHLPSARVRAPRLAVADLVARRRSRLGPNLSVSYRRPLPVVRGHRQYLFDADGQRFLDAVNNVAHVGHSHPAVVGAVARQMAVLNTNTRYLHENLTAYAERLTALLPAALSVCFIVCTGSEAGELALRLARAHTGRSGVIVLDGAYHGNTSALVDISPYKFDGPGGRGCPPHVRKVRTPDLFRGAYRREDPDAGTRYARDVAAAAGQLAAGGAGVAAFFCESLLGCAGQIVLPDGYLTASYAAARAAGAVCVADEVQVGFGRVGTHTWGFETQRVVPDIVTMGKPIGNGFPLAAVVTTPEIAASFDTGMEYFNTYGGNPVSCAAGLAVLDVMRDEGLQARARVVGAHLARGLQNLLSRFPVVGDVRGLGMFLGVELVRSRETLEPAAEQAAYVVNRMRERGVLVSTDGPLHNVIKIKPPLPFSTGDADRLVDTLENILREDAAQP